MKPITRYMSYVPTFIKSKLFELFFSDRNSVKCTYFLYGWKLFFNDFS